MFRQNHNQICKEATARFFQKSLSPLKANHLQSCVGGLDNSDYPHDIASITHTSLWQNWRKQRNALTMTKCHYSCRKWRKTLARIKWDWWNYNLIFSTETSASFVCKLEFTFGIISYWDVNSLKWTRLCDPAKSDSIKCGREHCSIITPRDEISSALEYILIHTQTFLHLSSWHKRK